MRWQIYLNYDEDSLTTFANAGLIRRAKKSLDEVKPQQHDSQLHFIVEDFHVQLPIQGISTAQCDCPAQGCCKHILSSILWLQQHPEHLQAEAAQSDQISDITPVVSALENALQLQPLKLQKMLRKAERQLTYQIFSEWQQQPEQCQINILPERISFKTSFSESAIVYFPQGDLSGMLSDVADQHQNACHLACIAYLFAQYAPEKWQWSEDVQQLAEQVVIAEHLSTDDLAFIAELKDLCLSFMRQGLSHIAKASVLALHVLNMQARAQGLPRLASALRRVHGLLQRLLAHDVHVEEQQIFDALAFLYHYLSALQQHAQQPDRLQVLRGQIQRDYQQQQIAQLIPLGCEWWITASGARGLSVCFWDCTTQQIREVTQARANYLDTTFSQDSAAQSGIWGSSLNFLLSHQLKLTTCKINQDDQISASSDSRFQTLGTFNQLNAHQFKQQVQGIDNWQQLKQLLQPQSSLFNRQPRYQLLHIQSCSELQLNEMEQCFECWIRDSQQQQLQLSLSIEPAYQVRINKLQALIKTGQIIAILVRIETEAQQISMQPCSLILNESTGLRIFSLDYDHLPYRKQSQTFLQQFSGRISQLLQRKRDLSTTTAPDIIALTLTQTQNLIEFYANTGRQSLDVEDQQRLQQLAQHFQDLGLELIAQALRQEMPSFSEQLLRWRHLLGLSQKLLQQWPIQ